MAEKSNNETALDQLDEISRSGETNMFDRPAVYRIAARDGYTELVDLLGRGVPEAEGRRRYSFLLVEWARRRANG